MDLHLVPLRKVSLNNYVPTTWAIHVHIHQLHTMLYLLSSKALHAGPPGYCEITNDYTTEARSTEPNHSNHWARSTLGFCFGNISAKTSDRHIYPEPHDVDNDAQQLQRWQMFGGSYLPIASLICFALPFWSNWGALGLDPLTKRKILLAEWQGSVRIKRSREEK